MATEIGPETARLKDTPLGDQLAEDACSFEFFQAVTLLQRLSAGLRPVGGFSNPAEEAVHFRVNPRLGFPASQIQTLEFPEDAPPEMTVNFMGLTGPSGALPYTYSELILERIRAKDYGLAAFFDIFNHRAISLFYRAWQRSRFPVTYSAGAQRSLHALPSRPDRDGHGAACATARRLKMRHCFTTRRWWPCSRARPTALEQMIEDYFEVPVEIQQFTGAWYGLDESTQCAMTDLDTASRQLGGGAVVGDAVWDRQARVRIRLGPLGMERYCDFLPEASAYNALRSPYPVLQQPMPGV